MRWRPINPSLLDRDPELLLAPGNAPFYPNLLQWCTICTYIREAAWTTNLLATLTKNDLNLKKRGIDLMEAGQLLYEPHMDFEDDRRDYGEERTIAKGYLHGVPIVIVYTERAPNKIHIISARKLDKAEEQALVLELTGNKKD